jgi:RND family efflux transporter MFP subunit
MPVPLVVLWLAGAGAWWLTVAWNTHRFRYLIRSARPAPSELHERLRQVADRLSLRRIPTVGILSARVSPMIWVPFGGPPRLLLPEELWQRLDVAQQDAVLAHELAHLKRLDHWVRRLESVACGLYWWDPIAWWARREVGRAEEHCCDAWVLWAMPAAAGAYAEALVATAVYLSGLRQPLPLGASGVGRLIPIKRRLQMILCDSTTGPVVQSAPRALLVLGVLSLPLLPAMASGEPSGAGAQSAAVEAVPQHKSSGPVVPPAQTAQQPDVVPATDNQKKGGPAPVPPAEPTVRVSRPLIREVGEHVDVTELASLSSHGIELQARVSGRLDQVYCRIGQTVKKGDLLFEIDPRPFQAELDKAGAEVRRAQARLKRWTSELGGAKAGLNQHVIGQASFNRIESEHEEAEAAVQAAQADRDLARFKLESTKVAAPIDGVISRIMEQAGRVVIADNAALAKIISLDPLYADFYIDEDTALFLDRLKNEGKLKPGAQPELPILIGVRDEEGFPHRGRLEFVDPEIQPIRETAVHCRAVIPNADGSLAPGLKARVRLVTDARHRAVLVPEEVVKIGPNAQGSLFVVNERNLVEIRLVRGGLRYDGLREVAAGLKANDWVVIASPRRLSVSQRVVPDRMKPPVGPSSDQDKAQAPRQ